jgi:hypothetical protein
MGEKGEMRGMRGDDTFDDVVEGIDYICRFVNVV